MCRMLSYLPDDEWFSILLSHVAEALEENLHFLLQIWGHGGSNPPTHDVRVIVILPPAWAIARPLRQDPVGVHKELWQSGVKSGFVAKLFQGLHEVFEPLIEMEAIAFIHPPCQRVGAHLQERERVKIHIFIEVKNQQLCCNFCSDQQMKIRIFEFVLMTLVTDQFQVWPLWFCLEYWAVWNHKVVCDLGRCGTESSCPADKRSLPVASLELVLEAFKSFSTSFLSDWLMLRR